jgi:hypothetical protein
MKAADVLFTRLSTFAGVTAIVGSGTAARIYGIALPQNVALPAIVMRATNSERIESVYSDPGMATVRMQLTCWSADSAKEARDLAEQVRGALERYGSALSGTVIAGVTVYDIHMGSEAELYDPEVKAFAVAVDYSVVHAE